MPKIGPRAKLWLASLVKRQPFKRLLQTAVLLLTPKHRVGVGIVVFNPAGQVLLLKHVFHPFAPWGVPSGWLDKREAPQEGALRELKEEAGLDAQLGDMLWMQRSQYPANEIVIFFAGYSSDEPVVSSFEILEARWFDPDQLPANMQEYTLRAIEQGVARQNGQPVTPWPAELSHNGKIITEKTTDLA